METSETAKKSATFGKIVSKARQAAGKTQSQVAAELGLSVQLISSVEHDSRALDTAVWPVLASILPGLTIDDMAAAEVATRTVRIDARDLAPEMREATARALAAHVRANDWP